MLVEGREDQVQTVGFSEILGSTDAFKDYQKFADVFFQPRNGGFKFLSFTVYTFWGPWKDDVAGLSVVLFSLFPAS